MIAVATSIWYPRSIQLFTTAFNGRVADSHRPCCVRPLSAVCPCPLFLLWRVPFHFHSVLSLQSPSQKIHSSLVGFAFCGGITVIAISAIEILLHLPCSSRVKELHRCKWTSLLNVAHAWNDVLPSPSCLSLYAHIVKNSCFYKYPQYACSTKASINRTGKRQPALKKGVVVARH